MPCINVHRPLMRSAKLGPKTPPLYTAAKSEVDLTSLKMGQDDLTMQHSLNVQESVALNKYRPYIVAAFVVRF